MFTIKDELLSMIRVAGVKVLDEQIQVENRGNPHKLTKLNGKIVVYTFSYEGQHLKIGKAGPKSAARVNSHHYDPDSSMSNLSKSILGDTDFELYALSKSTVGEWIKNNTERIDILIDYQLGIFILNFVEAYLHLKFQPKYEGYEGQRRK
ncbi:hypothetical protein DNH61_07250 [Paenibacillus sambharensis]|uniref:GIY-YIG nuclease family protein n=1 Tax=Paenibacillus sambharensis TaxID=1803190 RepID=A0A2W1LNY5_9BACL|nr:hypothetical protein [Paenibacillus sambharensis]PZD96585.1 hypothetical protein DNH61_07250 [Paenibacillus sambharensis]